MRPPTPGVGRQLELPVAGATAGYAGLQPRGPPGTHVPGLRHVPAEPLAAAVVAAGHAQLPLPLLATATTGPGLAPCLWHRGVSPRPCVAGG